MQLNLIWAQSRSGIIGNKGGMPSWHLPEDLARFKALTLGHPVIMGRKTWESLPPKFRPLARRKNIVLTQKATWSAEGAHRAQDLENALRLCGEVDQVWVIGGAEIYRQAEPLAHCAFVTEIQEDFEGDTFAPKLDKNLWREVERQEHQSQNGMRFDFVKYQKNQSEAS